MRNIIVREYLESLTERDELDFLFPLLLEVMGYKIISKPQDTKGLTQYGKDVVAVGPDRDGVTKRFYFEVKGGADRHVTTTTYNKIDGIRESIYEAKDRPYTDSSHPEFNSLPVKIVLVHNGIIHANVKETFDGFIEREFPKAPKEKDGFFARLLGTKKASRNPFEFERWDIYTLTELFTNHLFNEYLLTDEEAVQHFKKVLVLINTPRNTYTDYFQLVDSVFAKAGTFESMGERKKLLFFETLNLIAFVVYSYSKEAGNLNAAKKSMPYSVLKLWHWILENSLETNEKVIQSFKKHLKLYTNMLQDYVAVTLPVATLKNGIWAPTGGRYEQVGYPMRTFDYLSTLALYFQFQENPYEEGHIDKLVLVLNHNQDGIRPLLDHHSIPICQVLHYFMDSGRTDDARTFLTICINAIVVGYRTYNRLPDGRNHIETVLRYIVSRQKSIYYAEKTSHLMGMLCDYLALLDMEEVYDEFRKFIQEIQTDLGLFIPFTDDQLRQYLPEQGGSHELNLFDHELSEEGQQAELKLDERFEDFKQKRLANLEFSYAYRTVAAGFPALISLAHVYFKTPFFPNYWKQNAHS